MSAADLGRAALQVDAAALGLDLAPEAADRLLAYLRLLVKWNAAYNLTAVRDPGSMRTQHLADCLAVVPALRRRFGAGLCAKRACRSARTCRGRR